MIERTLVLVKPDGVQRALIGKVIVAFEDAGLKIVALKFLKPNRKTAESHYPYTKSWAEELWAKTVQGAADQGKKVTETAEQMGKRIRAYLMETIVNQPIVAMVVEGNDAVFIVRKITGATEPRKSDSGSIRGRFSSDSYGLADKGKRSVRNIIHSSSDREVAQQEIKNWFKESEIIKYERTDEKAMYG